MFSRQVYFSLLSSVFLFGFAPSLLAGNAPSHAKVDEDSNLQVPRKDRALCKIINAAQNPLLETNDQLDNVNAEDLLAAPLHIKIPYATYLRWKKVRGTTSRTSILSVALLENDLKVVIKEPMPPLESGSEFTQGNYHLNHAIHELAVSRVARELFGMPTLPPTRLIYKSDTDFQLRQYFVEEALSNQPPLRFKTPEMLDAYTLGMEFRANPSKLQKIFLREMTDDPEKFGRPRFFKNDLDLFECFIGAVHRTPFDYLWVPRGISPAGFSSSSSAAAGSSSSSPQSHGFFAIGYDQVSSEILEGSPYFLSKKRIKKIKKKAGRVVLPPKKARLAFLQKLEAISDRFPEYFEEGIKFLPDVYTSEYFQKMRARQETLLGQYPMAGNAEPTSLVRKTKIGK